jgi:aldose 1-epimerase
MEHHRLPGLQRSTRSIGWRCHRNSRAGYELSGALHRRANIPGRARCPQAFLPIERECRADRLVSISTRGHHRQRFHRPPRLVRAALMRACPGARRSTNVVVGRWHGWRFIVVVAMMALTGCAPTVTPISAVTLTSQAFGMLEDGHPVTQYTMTTSRGVTVRFIDYGGIVTDIATPDRGGRSGHVVLGLPTLRDYETTSAAGELYFGALMGRYANYVAGGRFTLDGNEYRLPVNNPPNTLHGGPQGFDKRMWTVQPTATSGEAVSARLAYTSIDGEEGFPGTLQVTVTYTLTDDGTFTIHYGATTDKDTVVNLSSHLNFNLAGAGSGDVLRQVLTVNADGYLPLDRTQIPLGRIAPVAGTPFDFRTPTAIGAHISAPDEQLSIIGGYDQYWVLDKNGADAAAQPAVNVVDPGSGRTIDMTTTEPGVQIYTGSVLNGVPGVGGRYGRFGAFTLETHHYPDSPNHPSFPTTELTPGQVYDSTTSFHFGVQS